MNRAAFAAASIILSLILPGALHGASQACMEYEPATVTLSGKITSHVEYGAPGFGEDPAHDEKEIYWYLDLDQPICVNGNGEEEGSSYETQGEDGVRRIQIVFDRYPGPRKQWVGYRATITGTLFHSDNGHHHTPVLIKSRNIARLR